MRRITIVSDFFANEINGGAELVDAEVASLLIKDGKEVYKIKSSALTESYIKEHLDDFYIVSNFVTMPERAKKFLKQTDYVIYEHDHKYLRTRDPSPFENFKAPDNQIINKDFYSNPIAVLRQSKKHAEVVESNLKTGNIVNLGCSLWSSAEMDLLEKHLDTAKNDRYAIMDSDNHVKGRYEAIKYCEKNDLQYDLIATSTYEDFISTLSQYRGIVFLPQVLETFSRLAVEARILNCQLLTNKNIGASYEKWFKLKGRELLTMIKAKKFEVYKTLSSFIDGKRIEKSQVEGDITVILNMYRRPQNMDMQIKAIKDQTVKPKEVWMWVNQHEDNKKVNKKQFDVDRVFDNNHNWKFYGRFAAALLADTEYVAIFDDDTIPGEKWFENCLSTMETTPGILGSAGVTLEDNIYVKHQRCGWPTKNEQTERVDLVGHAWFFKREWLAHLWREKPFTWDNGEDIQFSYLAQKYGGIQTYCPPHPASDTSLHGSTLGNELGIDSKATSNNNEVGHQQFFTERDLCVQNAIKNGWKTVKEVKL